MSTEAVRSGAAQRPAALALKTIVALHALGVFAQAVLAGQFLSGVDSTVVFHEVNAFVVLGLCLAQIVFSFVVKRLPIWFPVITVFVFLCEGLQMGTGYGRFLGVHIPLAILTFGLVLWQTMWSFGL